MIVDANTFNMKSTFLCSPLNYFIKKCVCNIPETKKKKKIVNFKYIEKLCNLYIQKRLIKVNPLYN